MNWLLLALIPAFSQAVINHLDKYLIEKYVRGGGIGSLVIFSSLIGLPAALTISLFTDVTSISSLNRSIIFLNGVLYAAWLIPYLKALEIDEASVVGPLFQLSSIFALVIGYLVLGEALTLKQMVGCFIILGGSLGLTAEISGKRPKIKKTVFTYMLTATAIIGVNAVLFKAIAIEESFWVTSFWEYLGLAFAGTCLFVFSRQYRKEFTNILGKNKTTVISLSAINEIINVGAKTTFNYATLLAPVVLVNFVSEGFQPIFVFLMGLVITLLFPKISKETLEPSIITQKVISISFIILGTLFL